MSDDALAGSPEPGDDAGDMVRQHTPGPGRDTKLTEELQAQLCRDLSDAVPRRHACARAGISPRTMRTWLARGRTGEEPFAAFSAAVKKSESDAVAKHVNNIEMHSPQTWQASAWMLERRWPEEFSSQRSEIRELRKQVQELLTALHVGIHSGTPAGGPVRTKPVRHAHR